MDKPSGLVSLLAITSNSAFNSTLTNKRRYMSNYERLEPMSIKRRKEYLAELEVSGELGEYINKYYPSYVLPDGYLMKITFARAFGIMK